MDNEKSPMVFATGMGFREVSPKAPESVRGSIYFKWADFKKFCEENVDQKGFVNVKMMKSLTKGSIYFILDTYKPKTNPEETQQYNDTKYKITPSSELIGKDKVNQEMAEKYFDSGMTDEELQSMNDSMLF